MHDLRQRHCPISTSKHAKKTSGCRVTHSSHGTYSYVPSVRVLSVRSAWTAQPCSKSEKRVSGTCGRRWASGTGRGPNLSKVGAAARNARCEANNSNSDRPEGSRRGAVVTPGAREMPLCLVHESTFPSLLLLHQQTFFSASSMSEKCHVWTAPVWQELSSRFCSIGRCSHVFGLLMRFT